MGLMPAGARNPFTKLDKQSVIGALKATASRDPAWSSRLGAGKPSGRLRPIGSCPALPQRSWIRADLTTTLNALVT